MQSNPIILILILLAFLIILFYILNWVLLNYTKKRIENAKFVPLCPRCGAGRTVPAGLWTGWFGPAKHRCAECGYEGVLIEVDKNKIEDFRKDLKKK